MEREKLNENLIQLREEVKNLKEIITANTVVIEINNRNIEEAYNTIRKIEKQSNYIASQCRPINF